MVLKFPWPRQNTQREPVDWMGRWYTVAKERGVNVTASFASVGEDGQVAEWHHFSHEKYDGIGGLSIWLKSKGVDLPELPVGRKHDTPAWHQRPKILLRGLSNLSSRRIPWLEDNGNQNTSPEDMEILVFTLDETKRILSLIDKDGAGQNGYILSKLNNILIPKLTSKDSHGAWLFPVNMRGNVRRHSDECNLSSGISLECKTKITSHEIYDLIKEQLVSKAHWANWWVYNIGPIIRLRGMRYLSRRSAANSFCYGTFSNMGAWDIKGSGIYALSAAPPGTPNYPISCGVVTWNGKLTLSLKIHPNILKDREKLKVFAKELRESLLE